jgi:esterase/lipase
MPSSPDTIVLIHGFWVTPRSWEHWKSHFEGKGYTVLAPGDPGFEVEVEALREDPTPIEDLSVPEIIEKIAALIREMDTPPILMGHSAGGVFTQIDHGFGASGVAINSAPTEGVKRVPALADQGDVPGAQEPCEPSQGRRVHARAVALRLHEHVH